MCAMHKPWIAVFAIGVAACAAGIPSSHDGLVEFAGAQSEIFRTGRAEAALPLASP